MMRSQTAVLSILLLLGASASRADSGAPSDAPVEDWRESEGFLSVSGAIESWLGSERSAAWREAVVEAPRAARLGRELLVFGVQAEPRLEQMVLSRDSALPDWFGLIGEASGSVRLAHAELAYFAGEYETALVWLDGLTPKKVYSPELLHYLRAACSHVLIDYDTASASLSELEGGRELLGPARGCVLDQIERDLANRPEELPLITRQMRDAGRRLSLGAADDSTRDRQQQVIDGLDELIKQLEDQQQQQAAAAAAAAAGGPSQAAEESRHGEMKGPGQVDRKRLVADENWGSLPPAERERLLQQTLRDYPDRYRTLVEDYFRSLAEPPEGEPGSEGSR